MYGKIQFLLKISEVGNRLDVGKRFVLLRFDLQKLQARELGRTDNYNLQTSGKGAKQVQKVKART